MPPQIDDAINTFGSSTAATYVPATAVSSTISYAPLWHITTDKDIEEKVGKATGKLDQHIDQLEADIDYFNRKLEQQDAKIQGHENCINDNYNINIEQDKKIKDLEDAVQFLKNYTNYLEGRIMSLEDKLNDKKVC